MLKTLALIKISVLTLGVASNTTPICNTKKVPPKYDNIVNNYELQVQSTSLVNNWYQNQTIQENVTGYDHETIDNGRINSNYINVICSQYNTRTYKNLNGADRTYLQNYEKIEYNIDNLYEYISRRVIVLQIDPYNYNVNTESEIYIGINIQNFTDANGDQVVIEQKHLIKNVYATTESDWSIYLNRQAQTFNGLKVLQDVTDPNNGFYYTKETTNTNLSTEHTYNDINDITTLNLQPNKTNYYIIDYVFSVKCLYYDYGDDIYEPFGTTVSTCPVTMSNTTWDQPKIRGTNVIPGDATYEVIDIPGLMWEVLTMPFAFVSQAFNLTLFPNTPYQINISNLFLSIVAIFVFIWLISFFLKMKG